MSIPSNFRHFTGKANLVASFNNWLMETIQGGHLGVPPLPTGKTFFWMFNYPIAPQHTPAITVTERGLFNLGEQALDSLLGFNESGDPIYGAKNQTLIEITCIDQDKDTYTKATNTVYQLRDKIIGALATEIIPLKDYGNSLKPQIGYIQLDPESNSINEKFIVDPSNENVKRYVILVRIFWTELKQFGSGQSIGSDAEIN